MRDSKEVRNYALKYVIYRVHTRSVHQPIGCYNIMYAFLVLAYIMDFNLQKCNKLLYNFQKNQIVELIRLHIIIINST